LIAFVTFNKIVICQTIKS